MTNPFEVIEARLCNIENLLQNFQQYVEDQTTQPEPDRWFDLNELIEYDPEKRTKPTFYGYVHRNEIPYHKRGKKLLFLKSEIDEWLKSGRKKTFQEISKEADNYLNTTKKLR